MEVIGTGKELVSYLGFYVTFNTVQVISRRVVERADETSTYSSSGFCTVRYCKRESLANLYSYTP